jgi:hypothetical protein
MGFVDKLRVNFVKSAIGINPAVFIKQLTSFPAYASFIPLGDFAKGIFDFWKHPIENFRTLMKSDLMQARYSVGFERDLRLAMSRNDVKELTKTKSFGDKLMFFVKLGDKFAIIQGGWAVYKSKKAGYLKEGLSPEEAHTKALRDFEVATKTTQQAADVEDLGALQRRGSFGKALTMFQTAPNQYYRAAMGALRNIKRGRGSTKANFKKFLIYWVILPSLFQFVADGMELKKEKQIRSILLGPLNGVLAAGQLLASIADWTTAAISGKGQTFNYDITPLASIANTIKNAISKGGKIIREWDEGVDPEDVDKELSYLADIAGKLIGIPTRQIERIGKGAFDIAIGETDDWRRLLFSEFVLGEEEDSQRRSRRTRKRRSRSRR